MCLPVSRSSSKSFLTRLLDRMDRYWTPHTHHEKEKHQEPPYVTPTVPDRHHHSGPYQRQPHHRHRRSLSKTLHDVIKIQSPQEYFSRKTRIHPTVTFAERERHTQPIKNSQHDAASFKTTEPQDVETSESTNLVKTAEYQDVETSEYGYAEVFGHEGEGEEYLVAARPGLTQKQLKRSSVAWLEQAGAVHAENLASLCANEETRVSASRDEQALDDVLDLILTLIPTREE